MAEISMGDGTPPTLDAAYGADVDDAYQAEPDLTLFDDIEKPGDEPAAVEEGSEDEVKAAETAVPVSAPDWLPDGIDWSGLPAEQKLAMQTAYERGVQRESAKLSDEERGLLAQHRRIMESPKTPSYDEPDVPEFKAPDFAVPDDYKGDPALEAQFRQMNEFGKMAAEYINALTTETVGVKRKLNEIETGQKTVTIESAWRSFTAEHPEAADQEFIAQMDEKMSLLNPAAPIEHRWQIAYEMLTAGKNDKGKTEEQIERGRKIRTAQAATPSGVRRPAADVTVATPQPAGGKTFYEVFKAEERAGRLPSQTR